MIKNTSLFQKFESFENTADAVFKWGQFFPSLHWTTNIALSHS